MSIAFGVAGGEHQCRADQRISGLAPDFVLRIARPQRQHPVMVGEVGQHPGGGTATAADDRRQFNNGLVRQFAAADASGLQHAKEAAGVQIVDGVVRDAPQFLGTRRALSQHRHQRLRAGDEVGVAGLRGGGSHGVAISIRR